MVQTLFKKEKCKGIHHISKCPVTSKEKRRELLNEYFAKKTDGSKTSKIAAVRSALETSPNAEEGRYKVILYDIEEVALGDLGADHSTVSTTVLSAIQEKHPDVVLQRFKEPMIFESALKAKGQDKKTTASGRVELSLTIILPRTELPVRIHNVKFFVADGEMEEVLLGIPLLKAMGFDLDTHLRRVATVIDGKSKTELKKEVFAFQTQSSEA
eukprot:gb/GEZJ01003186.1/.p1 GENE.gb/GEZJ01003186.1/~~gb/GEZJ01003186.1/.p1  ORF type:complete len:213 (-),score=30.13 gb/GEZJ01003186.1/:90-728(-)